MTAAETSGGVGGKAVEEQVAAGVGAEAAAAALETAHSGDSPAPDAPAAAPSTSSSSADNGSLHRSSTMPGGIKDAEIVAESAGSSNLERSKTERRRQNNPANDPAKQLLDDKISIRKKLKMLNRIATVKDDGTVVVDVPSTLDLPPVDPGAEDGYGDVTVEESLDGADIPNRPPMQIVILVVGTRGDVQPFVAIGKRLQTGAPRLMLLDSASSILLLISDYVPPEELVKWLIAGDKPIYVGFGSLIRSLTLYLLHVVFHSDMVHYLTYCCSRCAGTFVDFDLCLLFKFPDKIG